jgi:hypothetical protein
MVDCLKEICWKPLGVAIAVVFGFMMLIFCLLSYNIARRIKGFDEDDDTIFEYHPPSSLRSQAWDVVAKLFRRARHLRRE